MEKEGIMPDDPAKVLKLRPEPDGADLSDLWLDPDLGDGLTDTVFQTIPIGKPKDFFRVHSDPAYRRRADVYNHKVEGMIEEQNYILSRAMSGLLPEARPATIVTCIYRDGSLRLWPLLSPRANEKDNMAWSSARAAAREAMSRWVRIVWVRSSYVIREARPGYAPDNPWATIKLPTFDEMVLLGYGEKGFMRDRSHEMYLDLMGAAPRSTDDDDAREL